MNPRMPEQAILETVKQDITVELAGDSDRFSSSTLLMRITHATFKAPDGTTGEIYVGVGGNAADIKLGNRTWRINLSALAQAAWDADQSYLAKQEQV